MSENRIVSIIARNKQLESWRQTMQRRILAAVVFAATASAVFSVLAVEYLVVRKGATTRLYKVNADATLTDLTSQAQVIDDASPSPSPIDPPQPPQPEELTAAGRAVYDAARAINDPATAKDLAELHRRIVGLVTDGKIKGPEEIPLATKVAYEQLLKRQADKWAPVRNVLTDEFVKSIQQGEGDDSLTRVLTETSEGLEAASGNLQSIDLAKILRIIEIVLAVIEQLRK